MTYLPNEQRCTFGLIIILGLRAHMDVYWEQFKTPFLCFAGFSGVGKTTLLERLIKRFAEEDLRVGYYLSLIHI